MTSRVLVGRSLRHYWRTNLAVVVGVATAVAVLAGALLVGDSVRGSLRALVLERLGRTDRVLVSSGFFREALAATLKIGQGRTTIGDVAPMIVMQGLVSEQGTGRRASRVNVYGVDNRFWTFHGVQGRTGPAAREAFVSRALANDIGASAGGTILVRVERPSAIPIESLHGQKEDPGQTVRLTVAAILDRAELGEFSVRPQQGEVRAVFVPMTRLQQDFEQPAKVNTLLIADANGSTSDTLLKAVQAAATLEDVGLSLRVLESQQAVALEAAAGLLDRPRVSAAGQAAQDTGVTMRPVLTYLANTLRSGDRQVPYSLVAALDLSSIAPAAAAAAPPAGGPPPIVINDWTARELAVKVGDPLSLDYYVWREPGFLETRSADFQVAAIVPIAGPAADRDLSPVYPGITEADTLGDWDPPFPIDLKRVRPVDEEYWEQYRTTPKAFIAFEEGRRLWQSRYGDRTSVRVTPLPGDTLWETRRRFELAVLSSIDPVAAGLAVLPVREQGLAASRGATNFGEYFVYFSFFLVASALVLAVLFFRLGVEQRAREVGLLRAVGFSTPRVRRLFAAEGLLLAIAGSAIGIAGAIGYGALMMAGLRGWWSGAVGTTALTLHVSPLSLAAGAAGAIAAAMGCIWWTLRSLSRISERSLLAGDIRSRSLLAGGIVPAGQQSRRSSVGAKAEKADRLRSPLAGAILFGALAALLVTAAIFKAIDPAGAFFGAGASVLIACLCLLGWRLGKPGATNAPSVVRLGLRNTTERPGRSVLAIAVIASATFILISVDAFRRGDIDPTDRRSGTGGYPLLVDLALPLVQDPNARDGRDLLGLGTAADISVEPFRLRPGDDASCLNLYEPTNPRILGVGQRFIDAGRFTFQGALAASDADRANPWTLLTRPLPDGVVPIAADANSMTYVLHKKLGDEIVLTDGDRPIRLRLVAALSDSVFQGELLMSEANFLRLFPEQQGYRVLMVDVPVQKAAEVAAAIESTASDLGADAIPTAQRLAEFHAVENTYLSTFQTLGGLGLLVGTIGLAAVLLRNILERRRELALLRAVGYGRGDLFTIILAENAVLLGWGLAVGALSAFVAIAPAAIERGARLPLTLGGWLLLVAVLAAGLVSSVIATRAALRAPLIGALRAE
jgi:putative ABC transport system permease protein